MVKYSKNIETNVKICYHIKRKGKQGSDNMINDEICKLREKLNESIATGKEYDEIYKISVELDELIAEYYIKRSCDRIINKEKIKILM